MNMSSSRRFSTALAEKLGLPGDRFPTSTGEVEQVERLLAQELDKLSLQQQDEILFDIHGIPKVDDDDPANMEELLQQIGRELCQCHNKQAYEQSLYYNPEYATSSTFLQLFLRCEKYNPKMAAARVVDHFRTKRALFGGDEILGRDVRYNDLTQEEQQCVDSGALQVLPSRDAAGRSVLWLSPGYRQEISSQGLCRAHWYLFSRVMQDEDTQKNGVVFILYNIGRYGAGYTDWNFMRQAHAIREGLPAKLVANHLCFDSPLYRPMVAGMRLFFDEGFRNHVRSHLGNGPAVDFELQTFGIPTTDLPICEEQIIRLDWHKTWMDIQRRREEQSESLEPVITLPRRFDVLFGRGRDTRVHTGNLRCAHIVDMLGSKYERASKHEKTEIAERVVGMIHESCGRFLKWGEGGWDEVGFEASREKASHYFRQARAKQQPLLSKTRESAPNKESKRQSKSANREANREGSCHARILVEN